MQKRPGHPWVLLGRFELQILSEIESTHHPRIVIVFFTDIKVKNYGRGHRHQGKRGRAGDNFF